jgi:acyl-lipid omega-6 desaturase (Delta-12 desaturase)
MVMSFNPVFVVSNAKKPDWYYSMAQFARPDLRKSVWQLLNTLIPYFFLFAAMVVTVKRGESYWITLGLGAVAAALFVRIFIFFHDCTHGSFFLSPRLNRDVGYLCGVITFTAFHDWRRSHAGHHITAGDLDRRGMGDIWTMTIKEYRAARLSTRLAYRLYRNPLVMFGIGPGYYFLLRNRIPSEGAKRHDIKSVIYTDLYLLAIVVAASLTIGFKTYVLVQLPILLMAATLGVWLFYIQHQFQGVYWARHQEWDPIRASLEGASYYQLPKMLQWFSGNIGIHHLHHLRPGIPNYNLQRCYDAIPEIQKVRPITIRTSLKSLRYHLWDEERHELVSFGSLRVGRPAG